MLTIRTRAELPHSAGQSVRQHAERTPRDLGLRLPQSVALQLRSADRQPWVGDVGQDIWEMIELSSKGSNHGWSVREGSHAFHPQSPKGPTPFTDPVIEHHHTECRSIIGGYVYQGEKFPELKGVYIYGDYEYGKMWGLRFNHATKKVTWHREFLDSNVKMSSLGMGGTVRSTRWTMARAKFLNSSGVRPRHRRLRFRAS